MIVVDSSGLLAAIDATQRRHQAARLALEADEGPYLLSPYVLAEVDYLLATRVGTAARLALLREVAAGAYRLEAFDAAALAEMARVIERHPDAELDLTDASVVVLATRAGTNRLLTLDERHFRGVRPARGKAFRLLPLDA